MSNVLTCFDLRGSPLCQ